MGEYGGWGRGRGGRFIPPSAADAGVLRCRTAREMTSTHDNCSAHQDGLKTPGASEMASDFSAADIWGRKRRRKWGRRRRTTMKRQRTMMKRRRERKRRRKRRGRGGGRVGGCGEDQEEEVE